MPDGPITTTADFNAGTKTDTETNTENYLIAADAIGPSPAFADRISGATRKPGWTVDIQTGSVVDTAGPPDYLAIAETGNSFAHVERAISEANPELIARVMYTNSGGQIWGPGIVLYWDVDNWCRIGFEIDSGTNVFMAQWNVAGTWGWLRANIISISTWYYIRARVTATDYYMEYSDDGIIWAQQKTAARPAEWSGSPALIIVGQGHSDNPSYPNADFDNGFGSGPIANSRFTDITLLPYALTSAWESDVRIMDASKKMGDTTITHSGLTAGRYIDKIEWLVASVVKATHDTNITSGSSTTIGEGDLTSGTFNDVTDDFTIKITFVSDGIGIPVVEEVDWNFASLGGPADLISINGNVGSKLIREFA